MGYNPRGFVLFNFWFEAKILKTKCSFLKLKTGICCRREKDIKYNQTLPDFF